MLGRSNGFRSAPIRQSLDECLRLKVSESKPNTATDHQRDETDGPQKHYCLDNEVAFAGATQLDSRILPQATYPDSESSDQMKPM